MCVHQASSLLTGKVLLWCFGKTKTKVLLQSFWWYDNSYYINHRKCLVYLKLSSFFGKSSLTLKVTELIFRFQNLNCLEKPQRKVFKNTKNKWKDTQRLVLSVIHLELWSQASLKCMAVLTLAAYLMGCIEQSHTGDSVIEMHIYLLFHWITADTCKGESISTIAHEGLCVWH